jgi:hypothetical protein
MFKNNYYGKFFFLQEYPYNFIMVKVYYWHPNTSDKEILQKGKNDFGHISISAEHQGELAYLSFYPETRLPLASLIIPKIKVGVDFKTYDEDLRIMESEPDYVIELSNLDSKVIYNFITSLDPQKMTYNLYLKNCANVVYDALVKCSNARKFSIQYFLFKYYYKGMKIEKMMLSNNLTGYAKVFYRAFERSGFISPFRVLSFAKFIDHLESGK